MPRLFLFISFVIIHCSLFSQNKYRCFRGEYVSGIDTVYVVIESKTVVSKRYSFEFTVNYYVRNKPEKEKSQLFYCKQIDSLFYLAKDSGYFNLRRVQGFFLHDSNLKITDVSFLYFRPNDPKVLLEDLTLIVVCGDNELMMDAEAFGDIDEVYEPIEIDPEFPGGMDSLYLFIKKNIIYPESMREMAVEGTVYIQFTVETDGSLTQPKILRALDPLLDKEAIRLVQIMPKWIPGTLNGEPVRSYYVIPVKFKIE